MDLSSMMSDLLKDQAMKAISKKTGLDIDSSKSLAATALPILLGALKDNANNPEKAASLEKAIAENDGSLLDNLDNIDLTDGGKILGHIFGDKKAEAEQKAGNPDLLAALAPVVMGALGKANSRSGESASSLLSSDMVMKMANSFLDKDGDGDIKDDLLSMGMNFIKKKLSGK